MADTSCGLCVAAKRQECHFLSEINLLFRMLTNALLSLLGKIDAVLRLALIIL
jgi:hypothetical protein